MTSHRNHLHRSQRDEDSHAQRRAGEGGLRCGNGTPGCEKVGSVEQRESTVVNGCLQVKPSLHTSVQGKIVFIIR